MVYIVLNCSRQHSVCAFNAAIVARSSHSVHVHVARSTCSGGSPWTYDEGCLQNAGTIVSTTCAYDMHEISEQKWDLSLHMHSPLVGSSDSFVLMGVTLMKDHVCMKLQNVWHLRANTWHHQVFCDLIGKFQTGWCASTRNVSMIVLTHR